MSVVRLQRGLLQGQGQVVVATSLAQLVRRAARSLHSSAVAWHADRHSHGGTAHSNTGPAPPVRLPLPGVKHIVLISSAKGGVGKSTTAVNVALGMQAVSQGLRVGLLDADVFGPSLPTLMNIRGNPNLNDKNLMIPPVNYGVKCMSMGFLVKETDAIAWRGLMVMGAMEKLLRSVSWGELDVLVVDMPPGTGDVQLSIAQKVPISGAVLVSTPQDLALLDTRRGAELFRKMGVPVLGVVQNMAWFQCPNCQEVTHVFGVEGAAQFAKESEMSLLGSVPLDMSIREHADGGKPIVIALPDSPQAHAYRDIASKIVATLEEKDAA